MFPQQISVFFLGPTVCAPQNIAPAYFVAGDNRIFVEFSKTTLHRLSPPAQGYVLQRVTINRTIDINRSSMANKTYD